MSSTVLDPVADLIVAVISALDVSEAVTGELWDPGMAGMDSLPRGVVGTPTVRRTGVDEPESQIGSDDWTLSYPVTFYFDLSDAKYTQALAVETVEAFVTAIDTATLSTSDGSIVDAKVTEATPAEYLDEARPLFAYETTVELLKLV